MKDALRRSTRSPYLRPSALRSTLRGMRDLALVGFKNERHRAAAELAEARETEEPWTGDLRDAVVVYRDAGGSFLLDRRTSPRA